MLLITFLGIFSFTFIEASKILICVPAPNYSHQITFYPLINGLLKRGHEIVFITTDAQYPNGGGPANLTEINTHDISYKAWREKFLHGGTTTGRKSDIVPQTQAVIPIVAQSFKLQMMTPQVQELIKKKTHFDLIIVEGIAKSPQVLSHVFKAPIIVMNTLGGLQDNYHVIGAPIYPKLMYPVFWTQKLYNLSIFDKIKVLWDSYNVEMIYHRLRTEEDNNVKELFGPDTPSLEELGGNVQMLFLNVYPIWDHNRPVPPSVIYIGGIHKSPEKDLPKDLQTYLDSSKRGVVYFSLGTNVKPSLLPPEKVKAMLNGLAKLPYDVLLKWDHESMSHVGENIKVVKWVPQSDLLRHPNIKAFITQCGLQSFDEALTGGVPLVGIPFFADQWFNAQKYAALKIGVELLMEDLTEDKLVEAVNTVIDDPSYRRNMNELREKVRKQPQSALERAIWWTEHVIQHKGASHLRAPAANMSWTEYLDVELWAALAWAVLTLLIAAATALYFLIRFAKRIFKQHIKLKYA